LTSGVIISEGAAHRDGIITAGYLISCLSQGGLHLNGWAFITTGVLNKLSFAAPPQGLNPGKDAELFPMEAQILEMPSHAY